MKKILLLLVVSVSFTLYSAARLYREKAEKGDAWAQCNLGLCYLRGDGVASDAKEAVKWLSLAAKQGNDEAKYALACAYFSGNGVAKDFNKAVELALSAADNGHAASCHALGWFYGNGGYNFANVDFVKAENWLQDAVKKEYALANLSLGWVLIHTKKDYRKALELYLAYVRSGYSSVDDCRTYAAIGSFYALGLGTKQDFAEAVKWYEKAQVGNQGLHVLAKRYMYGEGVKQNYHKAAELLHRAAENGEAAAQFELAECYILGRGVPQNVTEAVKFFRMAAEQGSNDARKQLSTHYYSGRGVEQNYAEAAKWIILAADSGDSEAQNIAGCFFENGIGVKRDVRKAMEYYQKAAARGNRDAKMNLRRCEFYHREELK